MTVRVLAEVAAERRHQDEKWGGPAHDDQHQMSDWVEFIARRVYLPQADHPQEARRFFLQIAALAVAAIESIDRLDAAPIGGSKTARPFIYYRCKRCGTMAAPHQIEAGDDLLPTEECDCYMGADWVRGIWVEDQVPASWEETESYTQGLEAEIRRLRVALHGSDEPLS